MLPGGSLRDMKYFWPYEHRVVFMRKGGTQSSEGKRRVSPPPAPPSSPRIPVARLRSGTCSRLPSVPCASQDGLGALCDPATDMALLELGNTECSWAADRKKGN